MYFRLDVRGAVRLMSQRSTVSMLPSEAEAALAKETSRVLASHLHDDDLMRLRIMDGPSSQTVELPTGACPGPEVGEAADAQSGKANARIFEPDATPTYCLPSNT